ncbi:MAG: cytochrome b5 domain-containing protein [Candidatus Woesearchaeota archaeon]
MTKIIVMLAIILLAVGACQSEEPPTQDTTVPVDTTNDNDLQEEHDDSDEYYDWDDYEDWEEYDNYWDDDWDDEYEYYDYDEYDYEDYITIEELSTHNTLDDCWIAYEGEVYDITLYLSRHPGGAGAIIPYCGTAGEFEEAFDGQHGPTQYQTLLREAVFVGMLV